MDTPKGEQKLDLPDAEAEAPTSKVLRRIGLLEGQFTIPDDIKELGRDEIEEMFYGNPDKFSDSQDEDSPEDELKAQALKPSFDSLFPRAKTPGFHRNSRV
jgi:hypothetical protein